MKRYTILLTPDLEHGGYVVSVPMLPGCVTQAESVEEAIENAKDVISLFLEEMAARGEFIPQEQETPHLIPVDVDVETAASVG
ncbi:MAG: type II toxin-antitoxin system HicB family antitoxin [Dehalococcoidia bacterium]